LQLLKLRGQNCSHAAAIASLYRRRLCTTGGTARSRRKLATQANMSRYGWFLWLKFSRCRSTCLHARHPQLLAKLAVLLPRGDWQGRPNYCKITAGGGGEIIADRPLDIRACPMTIAKQRASAIFVSQWNYDDLIRSLTERVSSGKQKMLVTSKTGCDAGRPSHDSFAETTTGAHMLASFLPREML